MVYALTLQNPGPFWAKVFTCITHTYYGTPDNRTNQTYHNGTNQTYHNGTNQTYEDSNKTNYTYESYTDYAHANHTSDPIDNTDSWYWMGTALFVIVMGLILARNQTMQRLQRKVCKFTPEFLHGQQLDVERRMGARQEDHLADRADFQAECQRLTGDLQASEGQLEHANQALGQHEKLAGECTALYDQHMNWYQQELRALDDQRAADPAEAQRAAKEKEMTVARVAQEMPEPRAAPKKDMAEARADREMAEARAATEKERAVARAAQEKERAVARADRRPLVMATEREANARVLAIARMDNA